MLVPLVSCTRVTASPCAPLCATLTEIAATRPRIVEAVCREADGQLVCVAEGPGLPGGHCDCGSFAVTDHPDTGGEPTRRGLSLRPGAPGTVIVDTTSAIDCARGGHCSGFGLLLMTPGDLRFSLEGTGQVAVSLSGPSPGATALDEAYTALELTVTTPPRRIAPPAPTGLPPRP
jgi:hypothetical protein